MQLNHIYNMDCIEGMKQLPDNCVDCCITSPPYYGLRDYGAEGQIGLEETPELYVAKMVQVFAEVRRVLKPEGTLWLNLGDSYAGGAGRWGGTKDISGFQAANKGSLGQIKVAQKWQHDIIKPKDLIGIPWRVAFALQADGWWLRQDIIWHKPNPMPESVTDRCTKAHEYIFLMAKSAQYYYDYEAIKEPMAEVTVNDARMKDRSYENKRVQRDYPENPGQGGGLIKPVNAEDLTRNKRSVWTVTTNGYSEAHFATFPEKLIEPCVLAGCPKDVCPKCGKPWVRTVEKERFKRNELPKDDPRYRPNTYNGAYGEINGKADAGYTFTKTLGWEPTCSCAEEPIAGIILDPFMGAGTSALVATRHGRNYIGFEINPEYCKLIDKRLSEVQLKFA